MIETNVNIISCKEGWQNSFSNLIIKLAGKNDFSATALVNCFNKKLENENSGKGCYRLRYFSKKSFLKLFV